MITVQCLLVFCRGIAQIANSVTQSVSFACLFFAEIQQGFTDAHVASLCVPGLAYVGSKKLLSAQA
jgi:hypothetical protein